MSGQPETDAGLTPVRGLAMLVAVVIGIGVYVGLAAALGIAPYSAGFIFLFYFGAILKADAAEMPSALIGALGGICLAALMHFLPASFGNTGFAAGLGLVLLAIYALLMGWVPILVNNAFMLFLTVLSIPAVLRDAQFVGIAAAVVLAAAYAGALLAIGGLVARRRARVA